MEMATKMSIWNRVHQKLDEDVSVSVVLVTCFTGPCLRDSLLALKDDSQVHEVVIVDNGNTDADRAWITQQCENVGKFRLITGHGNIGFAGGANLGARHATGDRLLFLNPDAILRRGSIAALETARIDRAEPCLVGGRVFNDDGSEQRGARRTLPHLLPAFATFADISTLGRLHPALRGVNLNQEPLPDGPVSTQVVSGAMMYMSRDAFDRLNGFDESYFLHVEDIDICRRAGQVEGGSVVFTPLAGAMHYGGTSRRSKFMVEWEKAKGFGHYFRKFARDPFTRVLAPAAVPVIASLLFARVVVRSAREYPRSGNGRDI